MDIPQVKCWSFAYAYEGGRYSTEIPAATREEAEARLQALSGAVCEGAIERESFPNETLTRDLGVSKV